MDDGRIARVLPLTTTRALRGSFDYLIPAGVTVDVGTLVDIPFAHRRMLGVVSGTAPDSDVPPERLATIAAVHDSSLPGDLVDLAEWVASEYCSTTARALALMLPPGAGRSAPARPTLTAALTPAGEVALAGETRLSAGQHAALARLAADGPTPARAIGTSLLRRLEQRGLVTIAAASVRRDPRRHTVSSAAADAPPLTVGQQVALSAVTDCIRTGAHAELLLSGVTGSGKTEVYLAAAAATLAAGRGVIILVPEIGLTAQARARFEARLGAVVAVLHSGLTAAERAEEWRRVRSGEARVAIGARSAVFAPVDDLGLIVIDEEHESSYKHEGDPRYDARLVAARRARYFSAVMLSGSATPRPESVATQRTLTMPSRVDGRPLPRVEILDMRGRHHPLHPEARAALAEVRRSGAKAVVLLNRRGWSNFLSCADCGRVWSCPNCDVSLILHRAGGPAHVACHHCGHSEPAPCRCPDCGSVSVARHGAGTEALEQELLAVVGADPGFPVLRLDADSPGHEARARTLAAFHAAPAGVLVGTQMIAKGHDFADVSLGIVLDADQTLRFPDFRAEERTFALLTQLAGRTGRGAGGDGRVLVQTRAPAARPILLAARHDSVGFLAGELGRRAGLRYPPYSTLIRVICSSPEPEPAQRVATALRAAIGDAPDRYRVLGPAPLFRLRNRHRSQLQIRAADRGGAISAVRAAVDALVHARALTRVAVSVDVDPQ
ncbi:primosomal protein N' [Conexibacter sp. DBS9H8]|uniref:replication restart helicase PriA n=1 Tax=Conexibacter sp. DBS9H8 TaxID=2937801 RepID=UPI00200F5D2E|nr:primosomal protein N' [Conexibacter sp. DBS9H8]